LGADAEVIGIASTVEAFGPIRFAVAERPRTEQPIFLGAHQVDRIVTVLAEARLELLDAAGDDERLEKIVGRLNLDQIVLTGHPGAVALFGRMVPGDRVRTVQSAVSLAHAVSTHAVAPTTGGAEPILDEDRAEPHDGATLYRFATVTMGDLIANLDGSQDRAVDLAIAFARAFTTSDCIRPDFMLFNVRDQRPVNLAGAFEEPVRADGGGVLPESARRLLVYQRDQDRTYDQPPLSTAIACPAWLAERLEIAENAALPSALGRIRNTLADRLAQG
jgi:CRISPR system Cascade subunit CasC